MDQADTASTDRMQAFVRHIVATREHELDCRAVLAVIHAYVDIDVAGGDAVAAFPGIPHHLMQCRDCAEMVAALQHIASLEALGRLPSVDRLWRDLRSAVSPTEHARFRARGPRTGKPGADAPTAQPATGRGARLRPLVWLVPAMVLAGAVWWHAEGIRSQERVLYRQAALRAEELDAELSRSRTGWQRLVDAMATVENVGVMEQADGSWIRVFYAPRGRQAVILVGDLPELGPTEHLECWLRDRSGRELLVLSMDEVSTDMDWWLIEASQPLSDYEALALRVQPAGRPLFRMALGPAR